MKFRITLSLIYLTAAWLIAIATLTGIVYGLTHNTFDDLAESAPDIEFKQGVMIQTINGKQFIRETRTDGSIYFIPIQ